MASPVKILILRFSSIGDIVLTSPVVRCLKQQIPGAEVHFCTNRDYQPIVEYNPYIDKRYYLDSSLWSLVRQLRAEQYDYIIDLQNGFTANLIKALLGTRTYSLETARVRTWLYLNWKINTLPSQHTVDRYLETVQPLGVENDEMGLDYFIPYKDQVEVDWLPPTHRHDYVAFVMGGRHVTKRLPLVRMIELCRKINHPVVLLGDKEDRATADAIALALGNQLIFNACGLFNLNQSASLLQRARVVFSHDTGLMQVAAALKKKVYSIWGSSTPQLGEFPYKTSYVLLEKTGLACRPCSKTGFGNCPMKHFRCMNELPFDFEVKELRQKKKNFE
jgi:ADP-heptose:LPS heptosyltransferase